ncbi:phosphoenolpyruvate mutase [Pelagibacterales bacterium SAG-MED11]|nr:phosphoenolpyruvate mutase [Pelagibacterales bacterium SAG-MED11]
MKKKKLVYVGLSADILHEGHINILKTANKLGDVIVGLLTDKAIASYKKIPHLSYKQREIVLKNIKFVKKVIPQKTLDYRVNLKIIKPNFVVHGDDWKIGIQKQVRLNVIKTLKKWGGKLIEPKYTKNISSTLIKKDILKVGTSPDTRKSKLKRLIEAKNIVRILESHSALTGMIIENLKIIKNQNFFEFDGMWSSSLTDSALRGKPDNQSVDYSTRIAGLNEILEVTTKPLIFDADNGGRIEHLPYMIKSLERMGVSAAIIEDKIGLKKNSLFKDQKGAKQDSIIGFSKKISKAKNATISNDFFIIARIESYILGKNLNDALKRAEAYSKAGADAILIHSKEKNPNQIFEFAKKFIKSKYFKPMVAVPSSYSKTYEKDLIKNGFKIIIYANHLMRASYPAMVDAAKTILMNKRSYELEKKIIPIKEIINLVK